MAEDTLQPQTPAASWQAPDEVRLPLVASREALKRCEIDLVDALLRAMRPRLISYTPEQRLAVVRDVLRECEALGETENCSAIAECWQACETAHRNVIRAEEAYSRVVPDHVTIDIGSPEKQSEKKEGTSS